MDAIARMIARADAAAAWGSLQVGRPADDGGCWRRLCDLNEPALVERIVRRVHAMDGYADDPLKVVGNYVFRYLCNVPLQAAGFLFASERRVLALHPGLLVRDAEWLQSWNFLEPGVFVLPGDPIASETQAATVHSESALTHALFGEIERSFAPLIESFHACRFVAQSNAWASVLDYLAAGFIQAGHEGLGSEQAWDLWNGTVAASPFPTKRRPRRFQFGDSEVAVRAGCCLWYVTDRAKAAPQRYCTTCYLLPDQQRLAALTRA